jgi:AcrR family transcriptional regulator
MPKVLPEYLELRRQQILDAAAACFSRRGFHQTTMQDICEESGLSPGAVYRYFPGKEAIIEGMTARGQNQNAEAIEYAMSKERTLDVFDELIRIFFIELESLRSAEICALNVELISEAPRSERIRESLQRTNQNVRSMFVQLVERAQAAGEIDPALESESVARVMVALYQGFITQRLVEPDADAGGYAEVLRALFGGTFWHGEHLTAEDATSRHAIPSSERPEPAVSLLRH